MALSYAFLLDGARFFASSSARRCYQGRGEVSTGGHEFVSLRKRVPQRRAKIAARQPCAPSRLVVRTGARSLAGLDGAEREGSIFTFLFHSPQKPFLYLAMLLFREALVPALFQQRNQTGQ